MRFCNTANVGLIGASAVALVMVSLPASATEPASQPTTTTASAPTSPTAAPATESSPAKPAEASPAAPADAAAAKAPDEAPTAAVEPAKPAPPPPPTLIARINLTSQTMSVTANGKVIHSWRVSSGAPGYATPPGSFKPSWMSKMHYSRQYDLAPMPHSVFFNGGIAVHGTQSVGNLGRAASHGCVRLAPANAARFYALVNKHGMAQTRVIVTGPQPFSRQQNIAARDRERQQRTARASGLNGQVSFNAAPSYWGSSTTAQRLPQRVRVVRTSQTYWNGY